MPWEKTDVGVYRAELGHAEKIYHNVGTLFTHLKREHYRVHSFCSIELGPGFGERDIVTALKNAWAALRIELPCLAVTLDESGRKVYREFDVQSEQAWLNQSFFVEPHSKSAAEVLAYEPLEYTSLHFLPASSEVVLLCSHWRIDAVGTNWVLDRLFTLLAALPAHPPKHPTVDALSPPLEEAAAAPETCTEEEEEYARSYIRTFREDTFPRHHLKYKGDATTAPGDPVQQTLTLDSPSTASLIAACKAKTISITAAVHSALAQTMFALAKAAESDHADAGADSTVPAPALLPTPSDAGRDGADAAAANFGCVMAMNLRPKLPPPYDSRAHAVQTYVLGCPCSVRADSPFEEAARKLTRHYRTTADDPRLLSCLRLIYRFNADATPVSQKKALSDGGGDDSGGAQAVAASAPSSGITISSLGIVDQQLTGEYHGRNVGVGGSGSTLAVRVREYHFGIAMLTRQMVMYVGTFRGQLQMTICYNAGYYDPNVPQGLLSLIKAELEKGLALELEVSSIC